MVAFHFKRGGTIRGGGGGQRWLKVMINDDEKREMTNDSNEEDRIKADRIWTKKN